MKKALFHFLTRNRNKTINRFIQGKVDFISDAHSNINNDHKTNGELWIQKKAIDSGFKIFFDVGANKGEWSKNLFSLSPNIEVYAFDPNPDVFFKLDELSNISNLTASQLALADTEGEEEFSINLSNSIFSSFYRRTDFTDSQTIKVEKIRGDSYCELKDISKIDFLKIDVEGFEFSVLNGFLKKLESNEIGLIQFEYGVMNIHSRTFLKDFYDLLIPFGFKVGKLFPTSIEFLKYDYSMENFKWANYVAVHSSVINKFI